MVVDDPIVAEVRATRQKIETIYNNDFNLLYQQMVELQKQYARNLVTRPLSLPEVTKRFQHDATQMTLISLSPDLVAAA